MSRTVKRWILGIVAAVTTTVLILLPTAAQAGIAFNAID